MKLKKQVIKDGFIEQLKVIIYMIAFNVISFCLFRLSTLDIKYTESVDSLFNRGSYKVNLVLYILSWMIILIVYSIFYTKILKQSLIKQVKSHWLFVILFIICFVGFCILEIILCFVNSIMATGIFSSISNIPEVISYIIVIYLIGYTTIGLFIKEKRKRQ